MRIIIAAVLAMSAGCATHKGSQCAALREHFNDTARQFNICLDQLAIHADASVCEDAAKAPGKATDPALAACSASAKESAAEAAKP